MMSLFSQAPAAGPLIPYELRCEYAVNPLGVDEAAPRLSWKLRASDPEARDLHQRSYQVLVASAPDVLAGDKGDLWDSGRVNTPESVGIVYGGAPLQSGQRAWWKVRVWERIGPPSNYSEAAWWEAALLPDDWKANWIRDSKSPESESEDPFADHPAPMFRTTFALDKPVRRARAYASGLGYYELYLNGERIGNQALDPGWTSYDKRVFYAVHDVSDALRAGNNAIGMIAGNGWYNPLPLAMWGHIFPNRHLVTGRPQVLLQLEVEYEDGTTATIVTNDSWRVADSPILRNNIYLGERYDARAEQPGWNTATFDDSSWRAAVRSTQDLGPLEAQPIAPMNRIETIEPIARTEPSPGTYIFDLGQNFAGHVRLKVKGDAGTTVAMRYGELLYPDGTLNPMTSVCGQIKNREVPEGSEAPSTAWQEDQYTLRGEGEETYEPHFTWHGFRYVEVTGYPGEPPMDAIEGILVSSTVDQAGTFACSNDMFNQLQKAVLWTLRSNLSSVQTDCPHREKFGYGGDIVASSDMAMLNFDMARFYEKAVRDFGDAQRDNGGFTETAPFVGISDGGVGGESGPPGWGVVHPLLLRQLYQYYGNRRLIEEQYPNAKRWIDLLEQHAVDGILDFGISDHESLDEKPTALTGTIFYYQSAKLVSELARIIGNETDAQHYDALAKSIQEAFNAHFSRGDGIYDLGTQACQAGALFNQLVPENESTAVLDGLAHAIATADNHVRTGIFGTKWMLMTLAEHNRNDLAYAIVNQRDFPGWGNMLAQGATTLWEHWEFSDNTYSHNHPMFGSVSEWFYRGLAGIAPSPDAFAFNRVVIAPGPVDDLASAEATYESIRGTVAASWSRDGETIRVDVNVPPNVTAEVLLAGPAEGITEGDVPVTDVPRFEAKEVAGRTQIQIGSGHYHFTVR